MTAKEAAAAKAAAKAAKDEQAAAAKAAEKAAEASAKETAKTAQPHVYRTDLGEGLPAQKDTLNPARAK
jgi:hypothetical protein